MWTLFDDLVRLGYTVRRIREELFLKGYDLAEYEDAYLIRKMLKVLL